MDGMSDIRNEIEQRLGVFARQGAKETFANDTDSFLTIKGVRYRIAGTRKDSKGNLVYDLHGTSKTAHPVIYTLVKFLDDHRWVLWGAQGQEVARGKMEASRPGAKAAFGVWGDAPDKYRAAIDFIQNQRSPSSAAMNDLKKAIKAAQAEATKVRDPKLKRTYEDDAGSLQNVLEYAQRGDRSTLLRAAYNLDTAVRDDIPVEMFIWAGADVNWQHRNAKSLLDTVSALVARSKQRASRPGAKAKFGMTNAGYKALVDAIRVYGDSAPAAVVAQAKQMKQEPTEFTDNEVMVVIAKMKQSRASRPGAKEEMGRAEDLYRKLNVSVTLANSKEMERLASEALRMPDFMPEGNDWSLHELAEEAGREVLALKSRASRAGAKAAMAKFNSGDTVVVPYGREMVRGKIVRYDEPAMAYVVDIGRYESIKVAKEDVRKASMSRPGAKVTAAKPDDKTECADCETEQDKAGLKLMEKADKAVSDKIRTLIKEGKPQDQAVAIALDMKRRGEL